jgi:methionyl-tRNA formyltransferase
LLKNFINVRIFASGGILRIVFMGSPAFAVPSLRHLVLNGYDVVAVYTQPDRPAGRGRSVVFPPVKAAARQAGLPVVQAESLRSPPALAELAAFNPDVIVVCAFGQILSQSVLDIPPRQCLNVHFSLLPRHRGASPVAAAILAGDSFTGVSVQLVRRKLDTGPVLAAAAVPVADSDNTGTLTEKLSLIGACLLQEALTGWWRGDITPRPQDEAAASYFGQVKKEDGEVDWHLPALTIWRRVRAFNPWPGCYTTWRGKLLKITEAVALPGETAAGVGQVVALSGNAEGIGVGTGDGVLGLRRVQLEGKRAMAAGEFLRGQRDFPGAVLPC